MTGIVGIGVDLVDIHRIAALRERHGEKITGLIFRPAETEFCLARAKPDEALAARFAAKEAVMKALGTGWTNGVSFMGIEIVTAVDGRPEILLHGKTKEVAENLGAGNIHVSLSHAETMAIAQVIIEKM